jgi:HEPN domain-containing protein
MARKRFSSEDGFRVEDLLVAARDHLLAARCLLRGCVPFGLDSAGYLSHLAAELILKAWILQCEGEFSDSHVLVKLAERLRAKSAVFESPITWQKLGELDNFNELRYPRPSNGVGISEPDLQGVLDFINEVLFDALPPNLQNLPYPYRVDEEGRFMKDNRYFMIKPRGKT